MGRNRRLVTNNDCDTKRIGFEFGKSLLCGDVVVFYGNLGVGKTVFIKGVVEGFLGLTTEDDIVTSPSFGGMNLYEVNGLYVYHYDLYRFSFQKISSPCGIFEDIELDKGIVCIEWGERLDDGFPRTASICITYLDRFNEREILITRS